jgi:hypothetical protein
MPRTTTNKQSNKNILNKSNVSPITLPITQPVVIRNNSLFSSIKEGFGFGIGSTIARNMFGGSTVYRDTVTPVHPMLSSKVSCVEYNKCIESDDKYECFGNLDKKEYVECRTKD